MYCTGIKAGNTKSYHVSLCHRTKNRLYYQTFVISFVVDTLCSVYSSYSILSLVFCTSVGTEIVGILYTVLV